MFRTTQALAALTMGVLAAAAAHGQGTAPASAASDDKLAEVVVTARGREENLQEVPLSIAVFSADDIAAGGISDLRDLAKLAPNLVVYSGSGRADATALVVRGLSPSTSDERYQGLSTFVDGQYVSGQITGLDFGDVERVEVIYGPQGVKFGRATYSGAINYITRTPSSNELRTRIRAGYSQHGSGSDPSYRIGGAIELPLREDRTWLSLFASRSTVGSRIDDAQTGGPVGEERTTSVGGTLFFKLGDDTSLRLRFTEDRDNDSVGLLYTAQPTDWGPNAPGEITYPGTTTIMGVPTPTTGRWIRGAVPDPILGLTGQNVNLVGSIDPRNNDPGYPNSGGRDRERTQLTAQLKTTLDNNWELAYNGGYYEQGIWNYEDFFYRSRTQDPIFAPLGRSVAANFAPGFVIGFSEEFRNVSHELRLSSAVDQRLRWSAGLYYFDEQNRNYQGVNIGRTAIQISASVYSLTGPFAQFANRVNPDGRSRGFEGIENKAAFAGVEYDITDALTASIEGRYSKETVSYDACVFCGTINQINRSETDSSFDPRLILKYRFSDNINGYLQYATGVKSGRYNQNISQNYRFAPPEELTAYELGLKNVLLDNRLRLNAALFYQTIDKQQLLGTFLNPNCTPLAGSAVGCVESNQQRTFTGADSAGNSEIYGADVQASWRVTERFTLSGSGGYSRHEWTDQFLLQSSVTDTLLFPAGQTLVGKTTINTPRVTASLAVEYFTPIGTGNYGLAWRADANHTGKKFIDQANLAYIDAVTRFNVRAALQRDDGNVSVALFVRDLTDEATALGAGISSTSTCNFTEPGGIQRCYLASIPRGREIGVDLNFKF